MAGAGQARGGPGGKGSELRMLVSKISKIPGSWLAGWAVSYDSLC